REMAFPAAPFARVLVGAERDLAGSHFDALPIRGLDEPAAGQGEDPLRLRILMPFADPTDREHSHHHRHFGSGPMTLPLRLRRLADGLQLELRQEASGLMTDAVRIGPKMPVWNPRFLLGLHGRASVRCLVSRIRMRGELRM